MVSDNELLVYKSTSYYNPCLKLKVSLTWDLKEVENAFFLCMNIKDMDNDVAIFKYWDSRVKSKCRWIVNSNAEHAFYLNSLCKLSEDEITKLFRGGLETTHWLDLRVTNVNSKEKEIVRTMEDFLAEKISESEFRSMFLSNMMNFSIANDFSGNKWELFNYTSKRACNVLFDLGEFVRDSRDFWYRSYAGLGGTYPEFKMMSVLADILDFTQPKSSEYLRKFVEFQ